MKLTTWKKVLIATWSVAFALGALVVKEQVLDRDVSAPVTAQK